MNSNPLRYLNPRSLVAIIHDLGWVSLTWLGLYALRFSFDQTSVPISALVTLPAVLLIYLAAFIYFGLYKGMWRYASLHDLRRIGFAVLVGAVIVPTVMLLWRYGHGVPRSVYLLQPPLLIFFLIGGRIVYQWIKEELPQLGLRNQGKPVFLLSAGDSALGLVEQFRRSPNWRVVGVLDNQTSGRLLADVPVLGGWRDLAVLAGREGVSHAILADSSLDHNTRRHAFDLCEAAHVKLLLMPGVDDVLSGHYRYSQTREVELDDLLGRDSVELDTEGLGHLLRNKTVLVTGAGGSIGSELCCKIAQYDPSVLVLFEQSEFALYSVEQELLRLFPKVALKCIVGDVKDTVCLDRTFNSLRPSVVFHAAAYKHVPMMEHENAWAAVQNNVLGTYCLTEAISQYPVDKLVFISTDKAVNPTSVMGATKRLAEMVLQHWALRSHIPTVMVRFGNVLGSTGSVVPKFKQQIARGGPITVTHPEVRRYFMTVSEAADLVLQSGLMGQNGEIFVLDMGQPVKIVDLARDLIRLSGFGENDIRIEFSGLRPGEKLFEELLADSEATMPTRHPKVRIARSVATPGANWEEEVHRWLGALEPQDEIRTKAALARFVPLYMPFVMQPVATADDTIASNTKLGNAGSGDAVATNAASANAASTNVVPLRPSLVARASRLLG